MPSRAFYFFATSHVGDCFELSPSNQPGGCSAGIEDAFVLTCWGLIADVVVLTVLSCAACVTVLFVLAFDMCLLRTSGQIFMASWQNRLTRLPN